MHGNTIIARRARKTKNTGGNHLLAFLINKVNYAHLNLALESRNYSRNVLMVDVSDHSNHVEKSF